jgi:hypothetical protein
MRWAMFLTSGDVFFTLISAGAVVACTGAGLSVADSRGRRLLGASVFAAGLGVILSPMLGVVDLVMRHL